VPDAVSPVTVIQHQPRISNAIDRDQNGRADMTEVETSVFPSSAAVERLQATGAS
jgi:hypothetical protein